MLTKTLVYRIALNSILINNNKESALIFHHGMLGSARNFRPICKGSALNQFADLHLIDARNHGESPHLLSHSVKELASDLREYVEKIRPHYKRATILGHSMGGIALLAFTKEYPELQDFIRRVIIVDIPCNPVTAWGQYGQREMFEAMAKINLNQSTDAIFHQIDQHSINPEFAGLLKFNIKILSKDRHQWKANIPVLIQYYPQLTNYSLTQCQWQQPVELIYGSKSEYFQEEQIENYLKLYPQMSRKENCHRIEGARHWVQFDRKEQFLKTVQKILKRDE